MNLILFSREEARRPLPLSDPRAVHILRTLRRRPGDRFDAGIIDGPRGKATLTSVGERELAFSLETGATPPPLFPLTLIVGIPRPQTARQILREATALGVEALWMTGTERGEGSYRASRLWTTGEYRRHLVAGAEQAFCTRLPLVRLFDDLDASLAALDERGERLALDNYEATASLANLTIRAPSASLAVGSERGWAPAERLALRAHGFVLVHLGRRVLRTATACTAGIALTLAGMGLI